MKRGMKLAALIFLSVFSLLFGGCVFTKVVSVPMRIGGAVISVVPVVGNTVDDAIDETADAIDELPI